MPATSGHHGEEAFELGRKTHIRLCRVDSDPISFDRPVRPAAGRARSPNFHDIFSGVILSDLVEHLNADRVWLEATG